MSKKLLILPAFILGAFLMFTNTACTDKCKDVKCGTGTCLDGTCECGTGFEGTNCEIEWSAKFLGSYLGADVITASTAGTALGPITLTKPAVITRISETKISISNFGSFDSFLEATLTETDHVNLSFQDPAKRVFTGEGHISGNTFTGSYRVTFSDGTYDDATFSYSK